jgi:hypothetical protein
MTDASKPSVPRPAKAAWYYEREGVQVGPISEASLLSAARQGQIKPDTLVWQQAHYEWKEAASLPLFAGILRPYPKPLGTAGAAMPRRIESPRARVDMPTATEPLPEPSAEQPIVPQDLQDAVVDEEEVDRVIDVYQVREILERTSQHPSERSIPPAGIASSPAPAQGPASSPLGVSLRVGLVGASLLVGTSVVMFITRQPQGPDAVLASADRILPKHVGAAAPMAEIAAPKVPMSRVESQSDPVPHDALAEASKNATGPVMITQGNLDARLFLGKLKRALPMFDKQCWDSWRAPVGEVAKSPSLRVEMRIDTWGHVREIESSKPPSGYRGVGRCIIGRMRGWRFPKADEETRAVITVARFRD